MPQDGSRDDALKRVEFDLAKTKSELITTKTLAERRGYTTLEAIDFHDGQNWDVRISLKRLETVAQRGMGATKEAAYIVPHVLKTPTAIFQGVREDGEAEWLCYCGKPPVFYNKHGDEKLPPEDEVFLIFVNAERVAYNWRWEKCHSQTESHLPVDYLNRYGERKL